MEYTRKTYAIITYILHNDIENDLSLCSTTNFRYIKKEVDSSLRDLPAEKILKQIQKLFHESGDSKKLKDSTVLYFYFYDIFEVEIIFEGKKITLTSSIRQKWVQGDYEANQSMRYFNCGLNGGILYSAEDCKAKLNIDTNEEYGWFSEKSFVWFPVCRKLLLFKKGYNAIATEEE